MQESTIKAWQATSHLFGGSSAYLEEVYEAYLQDPSSVEPRWRSFFDALPNVGSAIAPDVSHAQIQQEFRTLSRTPGVRYLGAADAGSSSVDLKQMHVALLIDAFRRRGHLQARLDPLGLTPPRVLADLSLQHHGLSEADLKTSFKLEKAFFGATELSLGDIYQALQQTYCGAIGAEFMHITDSNEQLWLAQRFEASRSRPALTPETRKWLLSRLTAAEGLEKYIGTKFPGAKRFSLEGGESMIPVIDEVINRSAKHQVQELVIGMAHRGRLNVLVNVLGKKPAELFDEFAGKHSFHGGSGDVKYHQGFSSDVQHDGRLLHLALAFNPSHLEIVSPVVEGSVRARQERRHDQKRDSVIPVVIHGDSAFTGQGVVMETFNMSQARGYSTGGTIHLVVNNQVGFTTSNPQDTRSTTYCTDVAKMIEVPIFHVNGDDPEAVYFVSQLAVDYRMAFKKDVVIDLVCYRRHGHNEADEPSMTQPLMYQLIKSLPTARKLYAERLVADGVIAADDADQQVLDYRQLLDDGNCVVANKVEVPLESYPVDWSVYLNKEWREAYDSTFPLEQIRALGSQLVDCPEGFALHSRVAKTLDDRRKMTAGALPLDWGYAENMAYASLVTQGVKVRLSGQDAGRGTFSHRHSVLHNQKDASAFIPLKNLTEDQSSFVVIDSVLSEEAVLAFEYGYATAEPRSLVIWEAQFGDFANGAQVVIDQFISSGEHKWGRLCGLVMLLPHGYEGQGPEHSSARLERYLQLCAEHNIQVCVPSTPAQVFHMLRRQALRPVRKPLVVMTPKNLLRHRLAVSTLEELSEGSFQTVIGEVEAITPEQTRRVVFCSGKIYYELLEERRNRGLQHVALIRIEQLYPFPYDEVIALLNGYQHVTEFVWCQEEPKNQGAWYSSRHRYQDLIPQGAQLIYAGREASASPAAGYMSLHVEQQKALIDQALGN